MMPYLGKGKHGVFNLFIYVLTLLNYDDDSHGSQEFFM